MLSLVVALIPAHNEELTVGRVVTLASAFVDSVIVVDDGSTDQTATAAKGALALVIGVPHRGKGRAVQIGMVEAVNAGSDVVVCLDADLQHDPTDIPKLLAPIGSECCEMVLGTRFPSQGEVPWPIVLVNHLHARLVSAYLRRDFSDVTCGFRAFSRHAAATLSWKAPGFGFELEQLFRAAEAGFDIVEVPISPYYGSRLQPKIDGRHVLRIVFDVYTTLFKEFARSFRGLLYFGKSLPILLFSLVVLLSMVPLSKLRSRWFFSGRERGHEPKR